MTGPEYPVSLLPKPLLQGGSCPSAEHPETPTPHPSSLSTPRGAIPENQGCLPPHLTQMLTCKHASLPVPSSSEAAPAPAHRKRQGARMRSPAVVPREKTPGLKEHQQVPVTLLGQRQLRAPEMAPPWEHPEQHMGQHSACHTQPHQNRWRPVGTRCLPGLLTNTDPTINCSDLG